MYLSMRWQVSGSRNQEFRRLAVERDVLRQQVLSDQLYQALSQDEKRVPLEELAGLHRSFTSKLEVSKTQLADASTGLENNVAVKLGKEPVLAAESEGMKTVHSAMRLLSIMSPELFLYLFLRYWEKLSDSEIDDNLKSLGFGDVPQEIESEALFSVGKLLMDLGEHDRFNEEFELRFPRQQKTTRSSF